MILLTASRVAALCSGTVVDPQGADPRVGPDVVIDSRAVTAGSLFVALPGEHVDGHDYVTRALDQGAAAALVQRPVADAQGVQILVADPILALSQLARAVVTEAIGQGLVTIAITGSSGKTSTKDLLAQVLEAAAPTIAPVGSFNNEIGVPLTATRIDAQTRYLVSEMGARGVGHLRWLCSIVPPQISLVLNVGTAHLGEFGSVEQIALAKSELVTELGDQGWAVLNADDPRVAEMAARTVGRLAWFSVTGRPDRPAGEPVVWAEQISADALQRPRFTLCFALADQLAQYPVSLPLTGAHQVANSVAAAAAAWRAGLSPEQIADTLGRVGLRSRWRMELVELSNGAVLVNDAYNANPDSMRAAIDAVAGIGKARREGDPQARTLAILGDMLELGGAAELEHRQLGELVASSGFDQLWAVGEYAQALVNGAASGGIPAQSVTRQQAAQLDLTSADVVLIKASRGLGLEWVAEQLTLKHGASVDDPSAADRSGDLA